MDTKRLLIGRDPDSFVERLLPVRYLHFEEQHEAWGISMKAIRTYVQSCMDEGGRICTGERVEELA